jgi:predicted nucleic acid-binding protein
MPLVEALIVGYRLSAPYLLKSELANVCVKKIRVYPTRRDTILGLFSDAWKMPIDFFDIDPLETLALAERLKLSAYDASYLWLARQLGAELVTLDGGLKKAAKRI